MRGHNFYINGTVRGPQACSSCGLSFDLSKPVSSACLGAGSKPIPKKSGGVKIKAMRIKNPDGTWTELETSGNLEFDDFGAIDLGISCECGARATGVDDYAPGHSSWCPVKESVP